jgi:KUP system potassium uptake protein
VERLTVNDLGYDYDGVQYLSVRSELRRTGLAGRAASRRAAGVFERGVVEVDDASYFLSRGSIRKTNAPGLARWRKTLFLALAHNAADPAAYFSLPADRTVTMGSHVDLLARECEPPPLETSA